MSSVTKLLAHSPKPRTDNTKAAAAALVTMVLWSSAFVGIRAIGGVLSPAPLALLRLAVASVTLTVLIGVALCLLAAVLYAAGVLIQKKALADVDATTITWLGCLIGTAVLLPWTPQLVSELAAAPTSAVLGAVYLGVFPTAIWFSTWAYARTRTDAGKLSVSTYAVPAVSVVLSWILLDEIPTGYGLVGGAVCLAGVAVSRYRPRRTKTDAPTSAPVSENSKS